MVDYFIAEKLASFHHLAHAKDKDLDGDIEMDMSQTYYDPKASFNYIAVGDDEA
jgi:hypothetical protein